MDDTLNLKELIRQITEPLDPSSLLKVNEIDKPTLIEKEST